jgi:hypothetical protein
MTEGVVKADHRSRRMVLVLVVAAVVVCGILFFWLRPWAVRFLMAMEPDQALRTIKWVLVILFLGGTPGAAYLMSLGRRILSENRFPPMGMKVLKDTPVLTGRAARIPGRHHIGPGAGNVLLVSGGRDIRLAGVAKGLAVLVPCPVQQKASQSAGQVESAKPNDFKLLGSLALNPTEEKQYYFMNYY